MKAGRTIAGIAGFLGGRKLRREEIREVADADMRATTQQLSGAFADAFKQCADRWAVRATAVADREIDRKSVVEGKSVSVRVDLGGRRIFKKKNMQTK